MDPVGNIVIVEDPQAYICLLHSPQCGLDSSIPTIADTVSTELDDIFPVPSVTPLYVLPCPNTFPINGGGFTPVIPVTTDMGYD